MSKRALAFIGMLAIAPACLAQLSNTVAKPEVKVDDQRVKRWVKTPYEDAQGQVGEELVFFVVQ